jgi:glycosyltransferase involved in cell wall biosynthesis
MTLVSHPSGNTFVRALIAGLVAHQRLGRFATALGFADEPAWAKILPGGVRSEIRRRRYDLPKELLWSRPVREFARVTGNRLKLRGLTAHETGWASVDAVYRDLDAAVAQHLPVWKNTLGLDSVYAYEDGALETLRTARSLGLVAGYDLPIAYWETLRRLIRQEAERLPQWEPTFKGGTRDSEAKLARKTEELKAAEVVVVPSRFVLDSLPEWARKEKRCVIAEFGTPAIPEAVRPPRKPGTKLRVLFAGTMSQRKGLADLFAAIQRLNRPDVELVVMGSLAAPLEFYRSQLADFTYEPTRPHAEVLKLMATCDVLCLPSIVEGRALVQQEAMACGLPLLVTRNAGAEDLVEEGRTGFLVPIASPDAIAERINWFADHASMLHDMGQAARAKAMELTWIRYADRIQQHLSRPQPV